MDERKRQELVMENHRFHKIFLMRYGKPALFTFMHLPKDMNEIQTEDYIMGRVDDVPDDVEFIHWELVENLPNDVIQELRIEYLSEIEQLKRQLLLLQKMELQNHQKIPYPIENTH